MQDIFYVPEIIIEEEEEEEEDVVTPPPPPPPPKQQIFDITQLPDGFQVVLSSKGVNLPIKAFFRVAYDITRGNPFSNYHPMDFDFSNNAIKMTISGGKIMEREQNHIRVSIEIDDFELRVTGFDRHRDLIVDLREEKQ